LPSLARPRQAGHAALEPPSRAASARCPGRSAKRAWRRPVGPAARHPPSAKTSCERWPSPGAV